MTTVVRTFRHPIGAIERKGRELYDAAMRRLGRVPYVARAQGARFVVDTTDLIDREIAVNAIWEAEQLEDFAALCRTHDVDCFLDIGANAGVYSVLLAMNGLGGEIIAFEPDPGNRARLLANIAANNLQDRIRVVPDAVGDKAGEVVLMEAGSHNRGESWIAHPDKPPEEAPGVASHVVRQIRFDDTFRFSGKTILVKMDVEGSEFHALSGMERTLRDNRCYLQVELYSDRFDDLKALFSKLGYRYLKTSYIDHYFTNIADVP
ncbi:FkbM family methyltransferase [Pseudorhodoplanes sp.]|uniref:FkbM family methyltransferase n=1 Tax=Pseudorhodoplanes sp. TaxID=1934341 RepID=UPI002BD3BCCD|nr:FkbM family methyltransferase [Pseudorhodoplanes sp.]HWV40656.1 FkbM family methyltransferase [Pseudorhodoplanes sp.]